MLSDGYITNSMSTSTHHTPFQAKGIQKLFELRREGVRATLSLLASSLYLGALTTVEDEYWYEGQPGETE